MPKIKTNKGALKRFRKTGKGGFKHRAANRAHINTKMSSKKKRQLRGSGMPQVSDHDCASLRQMMPGL